MTAKKKPESAKETSEKPEATEPVEVAAKDNETAEPVEVAPDAEKASAPVEFNPEDVEESEDDGTTRDEGLNGEDTLEVK